MSDIPKLKKHRDRVPINIVVDREIDNLYREAKRNGWDPSEIARRAVTDKFKEIEEEIRMPASSSPD